MQAFRKLSINDTFRLNHKTYQKIDAVYNEGCCNGMFANAVVGPTIVVDYIGKESEYLIVRKTREDIGGIMRRTRFGNVPEGTVFQRNRQLWKKTGNGAIGQGEENQGQTSPGLNDNSLIDVVDEPTCCNHEGPDCTHGATEEQLVEATSLQDTDEYLREEVYGEDVVPLDEYDEDEEEEV